MRGRHEVADFAADTIRFIVARRDRAESAGDRSGAAIRWRTRARSSRSACVRQL